MPLQRYRAASVYSVVDKMAANKRNTQQIESDRVKMNLLALADVPQADIAKQFGVSQPQVSYDLNVVRERWKATTTVDLEAARQRELDLLETTERRLWEGWNRAEREEDNGAAVRFAAVLLKLSEQRATMLGLDDNPPKPAPVDEAAREALLKRLQQAFRDKVSRELRAEMAAATSSVTATTTATELRPIDRQ